MLPGITRHLAKRMQPVMNFAALLAYDMPMFDDITQLFTQLHSVKAMQRIRIKLVVLVYRCLRPTALSYIALEHHVSAPLPHHHLSTSCDELLLRTLQRNATSHMRLFSRNV